MNVGGSESAEPIQAVMITGENTEANAAAEVQPELCPETTPLRELHVASNRRSFRVNRLLNSHPFRHHGIYSVRPYQHLQYRCMAAITYN